MAMNWKFWKTSKPAPRQSALSRAIGQMAVRNLVARYDSLRRDDPTRRLPEIRTALTETEQWFNAEKRVLAYAQCDELNDNTNVGSSIDTACRLTIGDRLTPVFTGEDAKFWQKVWREWAEKCGYEEDDSWNTMMGIILRTMLKHGDCICLLDPILTDNKLRVWDADQCCNISDFKAWGFPDDWRQVEGVVVNAGGRVQGYFVTSLRNRYAVDNKDATYLPRGMAIRLSMKKKLTEYRGEPTSVLRQEEVSDNSKDLLRSEIASSKLASELSLVVEQPDGAPSNLGGVLEAFNEDEKKDVLDGTGLTDEDIETLTEVARDTKTFAAFGDRAAVATVPAGTKVQNLAPQRPSQQMMAWQGMLDTSVGKSLGMMSCLSNGAANNSYSSGEIELEISWAAFREYARALDKLVDYCVERVCPKQEYEITHTEPISIDSEKEEKVETMRLQAGRSTLREQLGVNYEDKLRQLAYEKKLLEKLDLTTLAPFWQTTSGQAIPEETPDKTASVEEQDIQEDRHEA